MRKVGKIILIVAAALIVVGLLLRFPVNNLIRPDEPEVECAGKGQPTAGFMDEDKGCAISIESYNEWRDWTIKYDPSTLGTVGGFAALIGIPLLLIGLIVFVIGVVTDRRRAKASPVAGP